MVAVGTNSERLRGRWFQFQYEDIFKKREGRVFFAGEHTASPHAWINTAMKTAIREAMEIHKLSCQY